MTDLAAVEALARSSGFSGVVRVDREGELVFQGAYGLASRRWEIPNTPATRFGIASGTKGLTALTVLALVARGTLEHLLAHRSGIGDYLDEDQLEAADDYVMPVPVHRLATTEDYLQVLDGHPQVSPPGERFAYNNGGFVVLALIAESAADVHQLWDAVTSGRVVPPELVAAMTAPRDRDPSNGRRHGLGMWLDGTDDDVLVLSGSDAGVSPV